MTRPYVFGTNFKMNQTPAESAAFYRQVAATIAIPAKARVFVLPPFTSLSAVSDAAGAEPHAIWIGAQNTHWAPEGAYTGEISLHMLQALDVDLVLLGHAERRQHFQEEDVDLNRKLLAALDANMRVLFALGETADERNFGVSAETVLRQLKIGLHGARAEQLSLLHVGYEPVWCIGAGGTPATPEAIEPIAALLRDALADLFGEPGQDVPVLYGGSVDRNNAGAYTALPNVDGLFIGRAGWTVDGFLATYEAGLDGYHQKHQIP